MPSFSITFLERVLAGTVIATISSRPSRPKPAASAARAGRVAVPPVIGCQAPADLDGRRERRRKRHVRESHEADEAGNARQLRGPQATPVLDEVPANPLGRRVTLGPRCDGGKELHHARIGIERRKRREVLVLSRAQHQARRTLRHHGRGTLDGQRVA